VTIAGLENNVEYAFKVRLFEPKEGPSEWHKPTFFATPKRVAFPMTSYNGAGGDLEFSCQQSSHSSVVFLCVTLLLLFLWRLRHRQQYPIVMHMIMLMVIAVFFVPQSSHAEFGQMNLGILGAMY